MEDGNPIVWEGHAAQCKSSPQPQGSLCQAFLNLHRLCPQPLHYCGKIGHRREGKPWIQNGKKEAGGLWHTLLVLALRKQGQVDLWRPAWSTDQGLGQSEQQRETLSGKRNKERKLRGG